MRSPVACRSTAPKKMLIPMMALGASGLFFGAPAFAAPTPSAPGDNGNVKVHRSTTDPMDRRNEPKVCLFYLVGFNFDADQDLEYRIVEGPPFKSPAVLTGGINIDGQGYGKTGNLSLPDGHYKLFVTFAGENGKAKQKVFKVACPAALPDVDPDVDPDADPDPDPDLGVDGGSDPGTDNGASPGSLPRELDVDDAVLPVGGVATGDGGMASASGPSTLPLALFGGGLVTLAGLSARRVWLRR